jgi:hypothetical protein
VSIFILSTVILSTVRRRILTTHFLKALVNGSCNTVVEQLTTLCEIEGWNSAVCLYAPGKIWQKNKAECIMFGAGYVKGNQIVVFTIDCYSTMWIKK